MAANRVQIELDEELVLRARARAATTDVSDSDLIADEADRLAVDEVRAHRASRHSAA